MISAFPWPGGKRHMLKDLVGILPRHQAYIEVFSGSAKLLFNKPLSAWELLNDLNGEVINFFRVAKHRPAELAEVFEAELVHADRFKELRAAPATSSELERAFRFGYLAWFSFGGKQEHFAGGFLEEPRSIRRSLLAVRAVLDQVTERLRNVLLESRDCVACVRRYDREGSLFFLDPPYVGSSDRVGTYEEMPMEKHLELAEVLGRIRGRFIATYNDHPYVRDLYSGMRGVVLTPISRMYTLAGKSRPTEGRQLIITNYRLPKLAARLALRKAGSARIAAAALLAAKFGLGLVIGAATAVAGL